MFRLDFTKPKTVMSDQYDSYTPSLVEARLELSVKNDYFVATVVEAMAISGWKFERFTEDKE